MIKIDDEILFYNIKFGPRKLTEYWSKVWEECGSAGRFYIDIAKRLPQNRFVTRHGEWSLPWKQNLLPQFRMPEYNPDFRLSFEQVTDNRSIEIKKRIYNGERFAVMYSGGMDSTLVLAALVKNLGAKELESVVVNASIHSVIENPVFWEKFVMGKIKVLDSNVHTYDDLFRMGYTPITADQGDCIFGTSFGLSLYHNFDYYADDYRSLRGLKYQISNPDVHYSEYRPIIERHMAYEPSPRGWNFGRLLYEKVDRNIKTSTVPIHSLHDFFWWMIFNIKYFNCASRSAIFFNLSIPIKTALETIENWFGNDEYQLWSMANNNNGEKIHKTLASYKYAQRRYIYSVDRNEWYFNLKTKLESLGNLLINGKLSEQKDYTEIKGKHIIGLTKDYQVMSVLDKGCRDYFRHHLANCRVDWC